MGTVESPGPRPTESNRFAKRSAERRRPAAGSATHNDAKPARMFRETRRRRRAPLRATVSAAGAVAGDLVARRGRRPCRRSGDARRPTNGIDTSWSQRSRARRLSPAPSAPSTRATGSSARSQVPQRPVGRAVEAEDPDAGSLHRAQGGGQPADDRHRQVLDRAGRRLRDRRRDVDGAVPGQHHAGDAGALGRAEQRRRGCPGR